MIGTLVAAAALASAGDDSWAKFSAHQARSRLNIDVEIGTDEITDAGPIFWIRRTIQTPRQKKQISRVDTKSCPQMLAALRSLRDLPMPRPNMWPLDGDEFIVTADGASYSLTISAAYPGASPGDLTLNSNVGTPLAAWVDDTLSALDSCITRAGAASP
jgi:hypothetical protein